MKTKRFLYKDMYVGLGINHTANESELNVYTWISLITYSNMLLFFCLLAIQTHIFCVWINKTPVKLASIWYGITPSCQRRLRSAVAARRFRNVRGNLLYDGMWLQRTEISNPINCRMGSYQENTPFPCINTHVRFIHILGKKKYPLK